MNGKFHKPFFFSYKDSEEARTIHTKNDNVETMIENQTDEIIEELINCLLQRYQN